MRAIFREIHKIVQQVGFGAVGVNAVERAIAVGGRGCNSSGLTCCGIIAISERLNGCTRRSDGIVAVAAGRRSAVCNHNDKSRVAVRRLLTLIPDTINQSLCIRQGSFPVRAIAVVGKIGGAIGAIAVKTTRHSRNIGSPAAVRIAVLCSRSDCKSNQSNPDVVLCAVLIWYQAGKEIVDNSFRLIAAGIS